MTRRGVIGWVTASAWLTSAMVVARAQPIDVERPTTLVIGVPAGSRTDRVDVARTGFSRAPLPAGGLHTEWRAATGALLEHAPVVDARGWAYVVGARGEAVAIARDGTERWRAPTGGTDPGPAALLSDDTLVFVDAAGDAIGVRQGAVRWRSHVGGPDSAPAGPLPLDDGGVVVTAAHDLALLDRDGGERARTRLPEPAAASLLWVAGRVVVVGASGAVWTWVPGATEPLRVASFGAATAGGAALQGDHTLLAVVARQSTLAAVDLRAPDRPAVVRAVAPAGLWLGPPAVRGDTAIVAMLGPAGEVALALDAAGRELGGALLAGRPPPTRADAGAPAGTGLVAPLLVDAAGTLAFATFSGGVGVGALRPGGGASGGSPGAPQGDGTLEVLGDACPSPGGVLAFLSGAPPSVAGIAPLPSGSLVVACHSGTLVAIQGGAAAAAGGNMRPSTL
jgi:hypothetical protein